MAAGVKRAQITKNIDEEHLLTPLTESARTGIAVRDVSQWILLDSAQPMRLIDKRKMSKKTFF